jgi:hypothetical protein
LLTWLRVEGGDLLDVKTGAFAIRMNDRVEQIDIWTISEKALPNVPITSSADYETAVGTAISTEARSGMGPQMSSEHLP